MDIRQAGIGDLEEAAELFNAYRMFYEQPSDAEGARTYIRDRLVNEESVIFIARKDGASVGFAQLYPVFSSIAMRKSWILNDMFVHPDARNLGIGQRLLDSVKAYADETGAKSIVLETAPDNYGARKLYEKNGYVRDTGFYHYELSLD
ncbi:GNAT family N-acetyltransferase [Sporosarcina koreensis]|uniref:GNAT family N-acetyltransferase n=1 Tax=Sporosarcina koreensis TaxID=334735 RepID=UPI0005907835|nr:GNAT family N-acetyltransferase [Sporosarcina koreensis]